MLLGERPATEDIVGLTALVVIYGSHRRVRATPEPPLEVSIPSHPSDRAHPGDPRRPDLRLRRDFGGPVHRNPDANECFELVTT